MTMNELFDQLYQHGVRVTNQNGQLNLKLPKTLDQQLKAKLIANKVEFKSFLAQKFAQTDDKAIKVRDKTHEPVNASFSQQRLWFIDRLQGNSSEYHMPMIFNLKGRLDLPLLERVMTTIIERHEILRTVYFEQDGQVMQRVKPIEEVSFALDHHLASSTSRASLLAQVEAEINRPFDLSDELILRLSYFEQAEQQGLMVFNIHHIGCDGWSMEVLTKEFFALYQAYSQALPNPLPALAIQYADFTQWQQTELAGDHSNHGLQSQVNYWLEQLADIPGCHGLPLDYPRPQNKQHQGALIELALSAEIAEQLQAVAKQHKLTPFMLFHGALSLVLARHSNSHDIVVGTPVANRAQPELEPLIGFFINTLALRINTEQPDLAGYFDHVRQVHLQAQANQDVPFEQLVEQLKVPRSTAYSPLFQIMINTNNDFGVAQQQSLPALPGLELSLAESDTVTSKFDLDITFSLNEQGLGLVFNYDVGLFSRANIEQLGQSLAQLLTAISQQSRGDLSLRQLSMQTPQQVEHLLYELNATEAAFEPELAVHRLFEQQAALNPQQLAVVSEMGSLSYGQLNAKANQLAAYLRQTQTIEADTLVGLCLARSPELIVAMLAVLKAGGAYVPLDPSYPQQRIQYMLDDAQMQLVLSARQQAGILKDFANTVVELDGLLSTQSHPCCRFSEANLSSPEQDLSQLAYVIYTSGSTGQPKGVMIEHKSLVSTIVDNQQRLEVDQHSGFYQSTAIGFDAASWAIWIALTSSCQLVLANGIDHQAQLQKLPQVTHMMMTPSMLALIDVDQLPQLQTVIVGGEACDPALMALWADKVKFFNAYGPTEISICSSMPQLKCNQPVSIGHPNANVQYLVLDQQRQLLPKGAIGELYIGGYGLARGYLNQPELTASRFVELDFAQQLSSRFYQTGDLVRYLDDGQLAFVGRVDDQVKIRGFRIELAEIESGLHQLDAVDSAVVLAVELGGNTQLVAYVKPNSPMDIEQLSLQLATHLPEYMIPNHWLEIDSWPLTPNGKLDHKALPEVNLSALQGEYVAPQPGYEQQLAAIWAKLLTIEVDAISAQTDFFTLGGHSLLTIRLIGEVRRACELELSVQQVFDHPTIQGLAQVMEQAQATQAELPLVATTTEGEAITVSFAQQRLWFIDRLQGESAAYHIPMVFNVEGQLDQPLLERVIYTIIERHQILRTVYFDQQGQAMARVKPMDEVEFKLSYQDASGLSESVLKAQVEADINRPFDLSDDLILRLSYFQQTEQQGLMVFNIHHIGCDGWSMEILIEEFFALYQAYSQGQTNPLAPLAIQYGDFAHWQQAQLTGDDSDKGLDSQLEYWLTQLQDLPSCHSLLTDHQRPEHKQHQGALVETELTTEVAEGLLTVAKQHKLTPFMLLHGALSLLLSRHSNSCDIVVGTPVANRMRPELEPLIGFFINTLVLRVNTDHRDLGDYFAHVRQVHLQAQANQDVPFEQLVEQLKVPRSTAHGPLFQIMINTTSDYGVAAPASLPSLPGLEISLAESESIGSKFDLDINLSLNEQGVGLSWNYDVALFSQAHIEQLNAHLSQLLISISQSGSDHQLAELSMLNDSESDYLLSELNQASWQAPEDRCLHQWFEQQAAKQPEQTALVFGQQLMSFAELNQQANRLAHYLQTEHQVGPDTLVGICVERSMAMIIGILGILKAGGAYVPMDPGYPQQRLDYMVEDSRLSVVLTLAEVEPSFAVNSVNLDGLELNSSKQAPGPDWNDYSEQNLAANHYNSRQLAYVIYTSGSTGQPKGVMVEHHSAVQLMSQMAQWFGGVQRVGWCANYVFDASLQGLLYLFSGRTLVMVSEALKVQPEALQQYLSAEQVQLLDCTPSLLQFWLDQWQDFTPPHLLVGGEAISPSLWATLAAYEAQGVVIYNVYGPTECTVNSTVAQVTGAQPHIGKPVDFAQAYILTGDDLTLVPYGAVGELCLGGLGLARGYLHRPQLTQQRFIANPFAPAGSNERLYRTGDLVRYQDQQLVFVGRVDDQVKIRGSRLELGEVESQLSALARLDSALVQVKSIAGSDQLVAYVKAASAVKPQDSDGFIAELKGLLADKMPEYMVPGIIVLLEQWPLTANGKVDKKALPAIDGSALQGQYLPPTTETERQLVDIWAKLLQLEGQQISISSDFFALGGHSLLSIRLLAQIRQCFGVELSVQSVFEAAQLQQLASLIDKADTANDQPPLVAMPTPTPTAPVMVSFAQQRLWFIDQMQQGSSEYHMPMAFEIKGQLDLAVVERVFTTIIERHQVLRSVYLEQDGQALQRVLPMAAVNFALEVADFSSDQQVLAAINQPFDLATDLILRVHYWTKTPDAGILLINLHHIGADGWSMQVLSEEFFALYQAYSQGLANPLAELELQYSDFAHWQRQYLQGEVLQDQLDYWQQQLDQLPVIHQLPLDFERPKIKQHQGASVRAHLPSTVADSLLAVAKQHQLTPFMLLHGALSLVLSAHSNSHDIVLGTVVANRTQQALEPLIGFFVNTLVLRVNTQHSGLQDYLAHVRQVHLGAQSHQDVPFEQLVEHLKVSRSTSHSPLFQIMISTAMEQQVAQLADVDWQGATDVEFQTYQNDQVSAKFDLDVHMDFDEQGLSLLFNYDLGLFSAAHIQQLSSNLAQLLTAMSQLTEVDVPLSQLSMHTPQQVEHLLEQLNPSVSQGEVSLPVHRLFEQRVALNPQQLALVSDSGSLSYAQLNAKANQLAAYLRHSQVIAADTLVGLCLPRSPELIIAMLAVLKAGGAYVPLDPSYPQQRIQFMLDDAKLPLLLSKREQAPILKDFANPVVELDGLLSTNSHPCCRFSETNLELEQDLSQLAYVIYTSGSTGQPKGVMIEHKGLLNTIVDNRQRFGVDEHSVFYQSTAIGFDAASWVIWMALTASSQLVLATGLEHQAQLQQRQSVTHLMMTPSMLGLIEADGLSQLQTVIVGGEACDPDLVSLWADKVKFFNAYGPTEISICSSAAQLHQGQQVSIGRPNDNVQYLVLDQQQQLLPKGAIGELYIGGHGLARGYLNQSELTASRFVELSFNDQAGSRFYQTGDLVRYLDDGQLAFVGRVDDQVKVRGFRVELGEIESALQQLDVVDSAVVLALEFGGSAQLVAYLKPQAVDSASSFIATAKAQLAARLPEYMLPSHWLEVDSWPLTANGKLDKDALPEIDINALQGQYIAPVGVLEQQLSAIWANLLNLQVDSISADANFFALGGHSLLTIRLIGEIRRVCELELTVQQVFDQPTIQAMATVLTKAQPAQPGSPLLANTKEAEAIAVSFAQQRLWFIDKLQGDSSEYNMPLVLTVAGVLNMAALKQAFTTIIERHRILRTVYIERDGQPLQWVRAMDDIDFDIEIIDATEQLNEQVQQLASAPFDLATDLMLRVSYVRETAQRGVLVLNLHHIAADGWSMEVLNREFFALYQAYVQGKTNPLDALEIQYGDFAKWQRQHLQGSRLTEQLDYWQQQLAQLPLVHGLKLDFERPATKQHQGALVTGSLGADHAKALIDLASAHQLTPFMLLHGALGLLLSGHSNSNDIVIGTVVANRTQSMLESLIGFFVNTLVLRLDTQEQPLAAYLEHVRQVNLEAQSHQDVPFEQLVERLNVPRSSAHSPLFQIMLTTNEGLNVELNGGDASMALADVDIDYYHSDFIQAKFDLTLNVDISPDGVELNWVYDRSLFTHTRIEQFNQQLLTLLEQLTAIDNSTTAPLSQLNLLSTQQTEYLLDDLNSQQWPFDDQLRLHQWFEQVAASQPDAPAVVLFDQQLSFSQLNQKANRLARYLVAEHGVSNDSLVGLCLARSIEMIVGILAILKAGGAYVPLDPSYPSERLNYIVADAQLGLILTQTQIQALMDDPDCRYSDTNLERAGSSSDLAYVIYTSGSTGQPKGVMVEHRSVGALRSQMEHWFAEVSRVGWCANYVFDASVQGLAYLFSGRTLVMVTEPLKLDPQALAQYLTEHRVELLDCTPGLLQFWLEQWQGFTPPHLLVGGEAIEPGLWAELARYQTQGIKVYNVYGPTECTVNSTVAAVQGATVNIGKPLAFAQAYVLSPQNRSLVPFGAVGELYIGGDGLARGYLNQQQLTASRFIENPFYQPGKPNQSSRLYQTGDLVRYLPSGQLEFIARVDDQVKIRGFRVELGEVQQLLAELEGVDSAVVLALPLAGTMQLAAYVKCHDQHDYDWVELKAELTRRLPEYMVPGVFTEIKQWPLTHNGKIDKKALPTPEAGALQGAMVEPENEIETRLQHIWAELLNLEPEQVSTTSSFFALGGHSLLTVRLLAIMQQQWQKAIELSMLFSHTSIKAQAQLLQSSELGLENTPLLKLLNAAEDPKRAVIFIGGVASSGNELLELAELLKDNEVAVGLLRHRGIIASEQPFESIEENVREWAKALEALNYERFTLVGHSYGGALAMSLSNYLKSSDHLVELVMLDSYFEQHKFVAQTSSSKGQQEFTQLPSYLLKLAEHQAELFAQYQPKLVEPVPIQLVLAQQTPFDKSSYSEYLRDTLSIGNFNTTYVDGDHFTMLKGNSAQIIAPLIKKIGQS